MGTDRIYDIKYQIICKSKGGPKPMLNRISNYVINININYMLTRGGA